MTPEAQELEEVTWDVGLIDAEVKLYLLALIRFGDHEKAREVAGLSEMSARTARGWLREVGVISPAGDINGETLAGARHDELSLEIV